MPTPRPFRILLILALLLSIVGCSGTVCSKIGDARATLNLGLEATHMAKTLGYLKAADEAVLLPYARAVDASLTEAENFCIAEQQANKAGDTVASKTALQHAADYLKIASAGLTAFENAQPPQVKAVKATIASTQPSK